MDAYDLFVKSYHKGSAFFTRASYADRSAFASEYPSTPLWYLIWVDNDDRLTTDVVPFPRTSPDGYLIDSRRRSLLDFISWRQRLLTGGFLSIPVWPTADIAQVVMNYHHEQKWAQKIEDDVPSF